MNKKDWIQYSSALLVLLSGIVLAYLSFFFNSYMLGEGVLAYVAQCFIYAGSVFGITVYIRNKFAELKDGIKNTSEEKLEDSEK